MDVDRKSFLDELEKLSLGIDAKGGYGNVDAFFFHKGYAVAYMAHGEKAVIVPTILKDTPDECGVSFPGVLSVLKQFQEDTIDVSFTDKSFVVKTKNKELSLPLLKCEGEKSSAPYNAIVEMCVKECEEAEWKDLPEGFIQDLKSCLTYTGDDDSELDIVFIDHDTMYALDGHQLLHTIIDDLGFDYFGLPAASMMWALRDKQELKQIAKKENRIFFRDTDGAVFAFSEKQRSKVEVDQILNVAGEPLSFPENMKEICKNFSLILNKFSTKEHKRSFAAHLDGNTATFVYEDEGNGVSYKETYEVGTHFSTPMSLNLGPTQLLDFLERSNDVQLCRDGTMLLFTGDKFKGATMLWK